ncbi:MAG: tetratricopeptide repeat protein, partial [Candidatus Obscuribacterales bacterium]|nr:tetratricopeptide repeat protein [Candidatus Obscuribacterales bacterium]
GIVFDTFTNSERPLPGRCPPSGGKVNHSGLTLVVPNKSGQIADAHIRLFTFNFAARAYATNNQIKSTSLHEIGHALGIKGHSDRSSDIMYPVSSISNISGRDKRTLAALYSFDGHPSKDATSKVAENKPVKVSDESIWVPSSVSQLVKDGKDELRNNNCQAAIALFKRAIEQAPNYVMGKRALANAYAVFATENWNHPEFALYLLHRSLFTDPQENTIHNVELLIRNINLDPKNFDDRVHLAEAALKNSDNFGAILEYKEALKIKASAEIENKLKSLKHPSLIVPDIERSKFATMANSSRNIVPRSLERQPFNEQRFPINEAAELNNQGVSALRSGKYRLAAEKFLAALRIAPDYHLARKNLGAAYSNLGVYSTTDSDDSLCLLHLSTFLDPSGLGPANLDCVVSSLGKNPRSYEDRLSIGDNALAKGDRIGAIVEYSEALKIRDDAELKKKLEALPTPKIPDDTGLPIINYKEPKTLQTSSVQAPPKIAVQSPKAGVTLVEDRKKQSYQVPSKAFEKLSGLWRGSIHVDSADFDVVMQLDQKGNIVNGAITCTGGGGISKHHFRGAFDPKKETYICKDIGVEKIEGSSDWFPSAVDQYSIHLVEHNSKLVGSCTQGNRKNWFSLTRK